MNHQQQLREAKILFASGQLDKSIESFNLAEEQGSDIIDTCLSRGAAHVALRRFEEAERDFSSVLEVDRHNERAFYFRGVARAALGQYQAAILDLTQSLENNGGFASVRQICFLVAGKQDGPSGLKLHGYKRFSSTIPYTRHTISFHNIQATGVD